MCESLCLCACVCRERELLGLAGLVVCLRVRVCFCVYVCVRGCASIFGAQKAQRTLKDTWPALTATPTAAERDSALCARVRMYMRGGLAVWA